MAQALPRGTRLKRSPASLFGAFVIAAGLGLFGGFLSERIGLRRRV